MLGAARTTKTSVISRTPWQHGRFNYLPPVIPAHMLTARFDGDGKGKGLAGRNRPVKGKGNEGEA